MNVPGAISATSPPLIVETAASPMQDRRLLANAINTVNGSDVWPGRTLKLHVDMTSHTLTVQIVNSETNEVLDQIPSEMVLRMALEAGGKANASSDGPK
jgi:uncharacterized FlaG/YvyC family protein